MKRFLFIILLCIFCFSVTACQSEVKDEIHQDKVDEVIEAIELLPAKAKLSDEDSVNYALDLYNALSEKEKALVSNIATLNEAVKRLDYYRNEDEAILKVVKNARSYLETSIPNYVDYKTTSITLPNYYEGETEYEKYTINFTWISSNNNIINTSGEVKHDSVDTKVTLTAKLNTRKLANIEDFVIEVNVGRISFKDISLFTILKFSFIVLLNINGSCLIIDILFLNDSSVKSLIFIPSSNISPLLVSKIRVIKL